MYPTPRLIRRIRRSPPECLGTICPPLCFALRAARFAVGPLAGQMSAADPGDLASLGLKRRVATSLRSAHSGGELLGEWLPKVRTGQLQKHVSCCFVELYLQLPARVVYVKPLFAQTSIQE